MKIVSLSEDKIDKHHIKNIKIQSKNVEYNIKEFIYFYWYKNNKGHGIALSLNSNNKWHLVLLSYSLYFDNIIGLNSIEMEKERVLKLLKNGNYECFDGSKLACINLINYLEKI